MISPSDPARDTGSRRLAEARGRAAGRLRRQRDILRPLGWGVAVVVGVGVITASPHPGVQGTSLGVTIALIAFTVSLGISIQGRFADGSTTLHAMDVLVMSAAAVTLAALQPQGSTGLAAGVAVWMGVIRLPLPAGIASGAGIIIAMAILATVTGSAPTAVLATTLLLLLLGVVASFIKQARAGQDRTELLLAQLEDAREEQMWTAAVTERSRIAAELHDVLAHSLSGAAIQLQAARKLAAHENTAEPVRAAIDRATELVKEGLSSARQAVGALRSQAVPGVGQLEGLIAGFRDDMGVDVTLRIDGSARQLDGDAELALYRCAQEALTNVARHASGATAAVVLLYGSDHISLTVEDRRTDPTSSAPATQALRDAGGGRGLAGMRERVERAGGRMHAGPTTNGWRVDLDVPT